jgi:hypothetical protein
MHDLVLAKPDRRGDAEQKFFVGPHGVFPPSCPAPYKPFYDGVLSVQVLCASLSGRRQAFRHHFVIA